jgi:uncharacterized protein YecE (DUF72 family)
MHAKPPTTPIRVGPAGWSYDDWAGIVYPRPKPRGFHEAVYLAQFFDTIEINSTFYHPATAQLARSWAKRVAHNPQFKFTAKLWQRFTHERNAGRADEKTVKQGMEPLLADGRLGALLLQFPWSFRNTKQNREYVGGLVMIFVEYPLVLEVRHGSWNHPDIFKMLSDLGVGFCNIDQPVIGKSIAPSAKATAPVGYVRLHGRNYEAWFTSQDHPEERYNYLYSLAELEPWAERIRSVSAQTDSTFVVTNNHFQGKAISNALQLIHLLRHGPVNVPDTLLPHYPELAAISSSAPPTSIPIPAPALHQVDLLFEAPVGTAKKD